MVYFDNSATTKPYDEVVDIMRTMDKEFFGNPSSLHGLGVESERKINMARDTVAAILKIEPNELYFTGSGTEANNLAIKGYLKANQHSGKHIITTQIEHPSVIEVYKYLENNGYEVDYLKVDEGGAIDFSHYSQLIRESTALVSIIYVNSETGSIQDLERASHMLKMKNKKAKLHVDAVQAFGKMKLFPSKMGIDMLSISSHKIHGPKGVGGLYVSKGIRLAPIIHGGGQEYSLRSGTENVSGICGFAKACEMTYSKLSDNIKKVRVVNATLRQGIQEIDDSRVISPEGASPYILNAAFKNVKAEVLLHHMANEKIFISTGSACSSKKNIRSPILTAMGVEPNWIDGAVRFSFSHTNTIDEARVVVNKLKEIILKIRF